MNLATTLDVETVRRRKAYYDRIGHDSMTPLWEVLDRLVSSRPDSPAVAHAWSYAAVRAQVMESASLISAAEAERRVLILENPALRGQSCITQSLYAGLQLIMPGEVAPAHRHTQSALRLVLDGEGAYTTVSGERTTMRHGDLIVTPAWTWHDHGNLGDKPVVWLDGLDIPIVRFLDASFAEKSDSEYQAVARFEGDAPARCGAGMIPVDVQQQPAGPTGMFVYPWTHTLATLQTIASNQPDPHFGYKQRYVNPATGRSPMPTIAAFSQLIPAGFGTQPYRCTDGTVYVCLLGEAEALVEGRTLHLQVNDILVVPSWHSHQFCAGPKTVLFSYSDRPVQQILGLWREERS